MINLFTGTAGVPPASWNTTLIGITIQYLPFTIYRSPAIYSSRFTIYIQPADSFAPASYHASSESASWSPNRFNAAFLASH
jgi:hypothetical protein